MYIVKRLRGVPLLGDTVMQPGQYYNLGDSCRVMLEADRLWVETDGKPNYSLPFRPKVATALITPKMGARLQEETAVSHAIARHIIENLPSWQSLPPDSTPYLHFTVVRNMTEVTLQDLTAAARTRLVSTDGTLYAEANSPGSNPIWHLRREHKGTYVVRARLDPHGKCIVRLQIFTSFQPNFKQLLQDIVSLQYGVPMMD